MLIKTDTVVQAFPLGMADVGKWVKVVGVVGGKNLARRLMAMGMIEDTQVQVLHCHNSTGVVVACGETRLAVGAGVAHKIMVVPV